MLARILCLNRVPIISRETQVIASMGRKSFSDKVWWWLSQRCYPRISAVVAQSQFMKKELTRYWRVPADKIVVIGNPVNFEKIRQLGKEDAHILNAQAFNVLAIGRLHADKQYDLLLRLFSRLDEKCHLTILGEGAHRKALQRLIAHLHLDGRVTLAGYVDNPYAYMQKVRAVLNVSPYESLPNGLLESIACGTPVVAFDAPGGMREFIENGVNGYLVPQGDEEAFLEKIRDLCEHPLDSKEVKKSIRNNYDSKKIFLAYDHLLQRLSNAGEA